MFDTKSKIIEGNDDERKPIKLIFDNGEELELNKNFIIVYNDKEMKEKFKEEFNNIKHDNVNEDEVRQMCLSVTCNFENDTLEAFNSVVCKINKKILERIKIRDLKDNPLFEVLHNMIKTSKNDKNDEPFIEKMQNNYQNQMKNSIKKAMEEVIKNNKNELSNKLFRKDNLNE